MKSFLGAASFSIALFASSLAFADNPDAAPAQSSESNAATRLELAVGRTQSLGFAAGLRGGHRLPSNVYVGGEAMMQTDTEHAVVTYGTVQAGYDLKAGEMRFMPYIGVGPMVSVPTDVDGPAHLSPIVLSGFTAHYEHDHSPFIAGLDARFLYDTSTDRAALALGVSTGVKF